MMCSVKWAQSTRWHPALFPAGFRLTWDLAEVETVAVIGFPESVCASVSIQLRGQNNAAWETIASCFGMKRRRTLPLNSAAVRWPRMSCDPPGCGSGTLFLCCRRRTVTAASTGREACLLLGRFYSQPHRPDGSVVGIAILIILSLHPAAPLVSIGAVLDAKRTRKDSCPRYLVRSNLSVS